MMMLRLLSTLCHVHLMPPPRKRDDLLSRNQFFLSVFNMKSAAANVFCFVKASVNYHYKANMRIFSILARY